MDVLLQTVPIRFTKVLETSIAEFTVPVICLLFKSYDRVGTFNELNIACKRGDIKIIKLLIEYGCRDINQSYQGVYPLTVACETGHNHVVRYLIKHHGALLSTTLTRKFTKPEQTSVLLSAMAELGMFISLGHAGSKNQTLDSHAFDFELLHEIDINISTGTYLMFEQITLDLEAIITTAPRAMMAPPQ